MPTGFLLVISVVLHLGNDTTFSFVGQRAVGSLADCEPAKSQILKALELKNPGVRYEVTRTECRSKQEWLALTGQPT